MPIITFENPQITNSGYTLTLGINTAQINYDNWSNGLMIIILDNNQNVVSIKVVSFDTNMIYDLFGDQSLSLNSVSNFWEWKF